MSGQSMLMTEYYRSLQNWINKGCPDQDPYVQVDLEMNIILFCKNRFKDRPEIRKSQQALLQAELLLQYRGAGLNPVFQFNNDIRGPAIEQEEGTAYKNAARLDWIRNHA